MNESSNYKRNLLFAIPYIALTVGFLLFLYGTFGTFESLMWKEFWSGFGKTFLASGIFALLLKTIQFMGVFKEELSKIVYDTKFLENRKDLPDVWENVSRVMFKNKFPKISKAIMDDIRNLYFPTKHVLYYDDYKQILEIELIDEKLQMIEVRQHSTFTIYPKDKNEKFIQRTSNKLLFNQTKDEVHFEIISYKVNEEEVSPLLTKEESGNILKTNYSIELAGEDAYSFETPILKKYSLLYDNTIGTVKDHLIHDFNLKILLKGDLQIDFHDFGTLKPFKKTGITNHHYAEYDYNGMIYPRQGYMLVIKKK